MLPVPNSSSAERWLLLKILTAIGLPPLRLVTGASEVTSGTSPVASVIIRSRGTLLKLISNPETAFGDGYTEGDIEVDGDLVACLDAVYRAWPNSGSGVPRSGLPSRWWQHLAANTLRRSRKNVHHHYDLNTDFYRQWLDEQLVYTCAFFPASATTLEEAQIAKMDYVCRKLQLQPGETVAEAGCGWGALALHMAKHYGVRVKAFNLSHEQIVFARQRARREGLDDRVEFIEDDYRSISGRFDVFVSVGMLEHVGVSQYPAMGQVIYRTLGNVGRGLLHFIGRNTPAPLSAWIRKRIFPGAYAPTLREAAKLLEPWDFSVRDVENLRWHYARTLEHWLERFERSLPQIGTMFDAKFVRAWRLYLAGSLVAFRVGTLQLFQVTFSGSQCTRIPWTRAHLYAGPPTESQQIKWMHATS